MPSFLPARLVRSLVVIYWINGQLRGARIAQLHVHRPAFALGGAFRAFEDALNVRCGVLLASIRPANQPRITAQVWR